MPAKDIYHENIKNAFIKEGWTITHEPLRLSWGDRDMYVDLGATEDFLLAADKSKQKIAIEVKSFIGHSIMSDLEKAMGQYVVYRAVLEEREPERTLYLAVPQSVVWNIFNRPLGQLLLKKNLVKVIGVDIQTEEIVEWLH
jgi:hypothetical protein